MRFVILTVLGALTLAMTALFVFVTYGSWHALDAVVGRGQTTTLNGLALSWSATVALDLWFFGLYLTFVGGSALAGIDWMRMILRREWAHDAHYPPLRLRGGLLVVKEPYWYSLLFAGVLIIFAAGMVAGNLGLGDKFGVAVGGLFLVMGGGVLFHVLETVSFDPKAGTWHHGKGPWPIRSVASGPLSDASHLVIMREIRQGGEGGDVTALVVHLAWRTRDRPALHLTEGAIASSGDGRNAAAIERWAGSLADLLELPLKAEMKGIGSLGELA